MRIDHVMPAILRNHVNERVLPNADNIRERELRAVVIMDNLRVLFAQRFIQFLRVEYHLNFSYPPRTH